MLKELVYQLCGFKRDYFKDLLLPGTSARKVDFHHQLRAVPHLLQNIESGESTVKTAKVDCILHQVRLRRTATL
jgi:hypothetical protein